MRRDMAVGANWFKDFLMKGIKMPKEEWGVKRICPTTGKRFYDLNKDPIVSPYTGEVVELDTSKTRMIAADAERICRPKEIRPLTWMRMTLYWTMKM